MQKKAINIKLGKIDDLETELKANRSELQALMSKFSTLQKEATSLQESYAYLAGQYSSMKNTAMEIGDTRLIDGIVKSLNESNEGYKSINSIVQKIK